MLILAILFLSIPPTRIGQVKAVTNTTCEFADECGPAMCKVWDRGRFVCEPKQYGVAVWDRTCLEKVELGQDSVLEAPLNDDGTPRMSDARMTHTIVTKKKDCTYRIEIRNR